MKVIINDFQSLQDVKLNIKGFTLLIGESSQGKSATFRAIMAAVSNRFHSGHVRHGVSQARIRMQVDNSVLDVVKPADGSVVMCLDGVRFGKLGRTVPSQVSGLLNMDSIGEGCNLNFHPQFEKPFLLEFSQKKVMELLSSSSALDDLNLCKGALGDRRVELKGAFKSVDAILSSLLVEQDRLVVQCGVREGLVGDISSCAVVCKDLDASLGILSALSGAIVELETIRVKVGILAEFIRIYGDFKLYADALSCLSNLECEVCGRVDLAPLCSRIELLRGIVDIECGIGEVSGILPVLDSLCVGLEGCVGLRSRIAELNRFVIDGICPICGNKIGSDHGC